MLLILTTEECSIGGVVSNVGSPKDLARAELRRSRRKVEHIEINNYKL